MKPHGFADRLASNGIVFGATATAIAAAGVVLPALLGPTAEMAYSNLQVTDAIKTVAEFAVLNMREIGPAYLSAALTVAGAATPIITVLEKATGRHLHGFSIARYATSVLGTADKTLDPEQHVPTAPSTREPEPARRHLANDPDTARAISRPPAPLER